MNYICPVNFPERKIKIGEKTACLICIVLYCIVFIAFSHNIHNRAEKNDNKYTVAHQDLQFFGDVIFIISLGVGNLVGRWFQFFWKLVKLLSFRLGETRRNSGLSFCLEGMEKFQVGVVDGVGIIGCSSCLSRSLQAVAHTYVDFNFSYKKQKLFCCSWCLFTSVYIDDYGGWC